MHSFQIFRLLTKSKCHAQLQTKHFFDLEEAVKSFYEAVTNDPISITDSREDTIAANRYLDATGIICSDTRDGSGAFGYLLDNPLKEYRDPVKDNR